MEDKDFDKETRCMYCGSKLEDFGGCAEDYGLHTPYIEDFFNMHVCPKCDLTVTQTDRLLKKVIDSDGDSSSIAQLKCHMGYVYHYFSEDERNLRSRLSKWGKYLKSILIVLFHNASLLLFLMLMLRESNLNIAFVVMAGLSYFVTFVMLVVAVFDVFAEDKDCSGIE